MLEGRLREGFVRIRQLMVSPLSTSPEGFQLIEELGVDAPRDPPAWALQSSPILRTHRGLRAFL